MGGSFKSQLYIKRKLFSVSFSGSLGNNLWVDGVHLGDAILVHYHHGEVGQVEDQPLLDLLDTLNHEGVRLLPGHVLLVVPVHDGGGEEASITVSSIRSLDHTCKIVHEVELSLASLHVKPSNEGVDRVGGARSEERKDDTEDDKAIAGIEPEIVSEVPPGEVCCS